MRVPASLLGLLGLCASAATALAAPLASLPFERPCRYGWRGPSCDERAFPACVLDGVHADCTFTHTCACFRQCDAAEMLTMQARLCYDSNASSLAEVVRSPLVAYRRLRHIPGFPHRAGAYGDCADCGMASGRPLDGEPPEEDVLLPTSSCPKGCSGRGSCSALADAGSLPGAVGTCVCWANQDHEPRFDRTFNGGACEGALVPKLCPGGCGGDGRGACVNGVCECGAGFFGTDCAQPDAGRVPTARPSIYLCALSAFRQTLLRLLRLRLSASAP